MTLNDGAVVCVAVDVGCAKVDDGDAESAGKVGVGEEVSDSNMIDEGVGDPELIIEPVILVVAEQESAEIIPENEQAPGQGHGNDEIIPLFGQ